MRKYHNTQMDQLKFGLLIVALFALSKNCFAQSGIKAGGSYNIIKDSDFDFSETIGYYVGGYTTAPINHLLDATADITLLDQRISTKNASLSVKSANGSFAFNVNADKKLYISLGFEIGMIIDARVEKEKITGLDKSRFSPLVGGGYKVSDKVRIELRYIPALNQQVFDAALQLGLRYKV